MSAISSPSGQRRIGLKKIIPPATGTILIIAIVAMFIACSADKKAGQEVEPVPVTLGKISHIQSYQSIPVSGPVVSPYAPAVVSFLVSGRVLQAGPREGDYVQEGQFLASIDPVDYNLAARAAAAQVEQARVAFQRTEDEYGRMKFLFESKSLAANDFQKYKAAYDAAKQQLELANANEQIARKHLTDTTLHCPVSGFIAMRSIEPGETAAAGRPVFQIVRLNPVEINVGVPETDIYLVKTGQKAAVRIPALAGRSFEGTVRIINIAADPATRTYMTRITVANPDHLIKVGMVAEARIQVNRRIEMMTLPGDAVVRDPQGATMVFVYQQDQKRVYAKRIETGALYGKEVEMKSGLSGNELIVVAGQDKLRDGTVVTLAGNGVAAGKHAEGGR